MNYRLLTILIIAVFMGSCQNPNIFEEEEIYIADRVPTEEREFKNKDLKIIIEKISRPQRDKIKMEISFTNLSRPDSAGKNMRILVDKNNSYLTDQNNWKWDLKGDNLNFTKVRVIINPGARIATTFYFEPSTNSPSSGTIFQLVLTTVYKFEGEVNVTARAVFKNLKIN